MTKPSIQPGVARITPYKPGESKLAGFDTVTKLASNESALGPSPNALAAAQAAVMDTSLYPDPASIDFRQAVADQYGIPVGHLVAGNGSESLLTLLIRAFAGPGDEVLQPEHAFMVYRIAALAVGAEPILAPEMDVHADVDALLERVTDKTRICAIANPGNPTGTWIAASEIRRLRENLPDSVLLIVDSAYADYPDSSAYSAGHELVAEAIQSGADNVVVTHTLSKIYGLAALRVGFAYGPPSVLDAVNRIREVFNVTTPAQAAGAAAMADQAHLTAALAHNRQELERLTGFCQDRGLKLSPSGANFGLVHFGTVDEAARCDAHLRSHGVIVRPVGGYGLPHCLRITLGRTDQMDHFYQAMASF